MRLIVRIVVGTVLGALLIYGCDCAVWRACGLPLDQVQVSHVTTASLKGNKEEYYTDSTGPAPCSRSLLPQPASEGFSTPCWWLRRHREVLVRD